MRKIRLERPANTRFSEEKADKAVKFFNRYLVHTKGQWANQPFNLRSWQEPDIREIFGRVDDDGNRLIRQVYYEIPKKQGKSEIAAGIALKLAFADGEYGAEIYGGASDRDQASIVFNVAASMVRRSPALRKRAKIIDSTKRILIPERESFYRAVSADVAGKHGYNSHGVIFDEVHAQRDMRLWEVLTFGAGDARRQPLTFAITTAGIPGESPVAEMLHDDADQILRGIVPCPSDFYPVIYAAPDDAPWDDEEVWHSCNPALGDFLNIDAVRKQCEQAKRRPTEQNSFRRLRLNQWVAQETRWIPMELWNDPVCAKPFDWRDLRDLPCYIGVDLSTKLDLTCVCVVWIDGNANLYLWPHFFVPEGSLQDRANMETAMYREWAKGGHLELTPGGAVDFRSIFEFICELRDERKLDIQQVAYDPQFAEQLRQQLEGEGFEMAEFRQSARRYTEPCQFLEAALGELRVRHGGHPVMTWCADNVSVKQFPDGRIIPTKPDRLKSRKRIDGIVAALMGTSRAMLHEEAGTSIYANPKTAVM